jgi:hypothetical protein
LPNYAYVFSSLSCSLWFSPFVCLFVFVFTFNGVSFQGLFSFPLACFGGWICDQVQGIVKSPISRSHVEEMALLKDVTGYIMPGTLTLIIGK